MAMMKAPPAILGLYVEVKREVPEAVLLGITGDARHVADGGYHISRSLLLANGMSGDYSIQHAADKLGDPDNSSAIDIGFGGYGIPLIKLITQRLLKAGGDHDPRMAAVREFYGCGPSSSSTDVIGWDFTEHARAYTSDYSHRGHIHLSIIRQHSNDAAALAHIADVIAGKPIAPPKPTPPVTPLEPDMQLIQFPDAPTPLGRASVFEVLGPSLIHVSAEDYKASGSPKVFQYSIHTSEFWKLPIAPGTTDTRK